MLTVLGGLAEFERDLIRARTGEGRARAIERGVKMGRPPKLTPHQRNEAIKRRDAGDESLAEHRPQLQCQRGDDFTARDWALSTGFTCTSTSMLLRQKFQRFSAGSPKLAEPPLGQSGKLILNDKYTTIP